MTPIRISAFLHQESILLIFTVIIFLTDLRLFDFFTELRYVRQFESFEDQVKHTLKCNPNIEVSLTYGKLNDTNNGLDDSFTDLLNDMKEPLRLCPIDKDRLKFFDEQDYSRQLNYEHIQFGGHFKPFGCQPRQKVAIVVPYRNRKEQLDKFLLYIHQFLPDQLIEYSLYIIEQSVKLKFNKGRLYNIGFKEINKLDPNICCFIFHDVDLLPLDQKNLYMCSERSRHLSDGVSTLRYKLLYPELIGGVISMTKTQFEEFGGFSNDYFGWGGEDDDLFRRVIAAGQTIDRAPKLHGIYIMLKHPKEKPNQQRWQIAREAELRKTPDPGITYRILQITEEQLFTNITVEL